MSDWSSERPSTVAPSEDARAELRQWVERWKVVGPILDAERWARLQASSDDELRRQSDELLNLWQPGVPGDDGEGIVLQQRVFARLRDRE